MFANTFFSPRLLVAFCMGRGVCSFGSRAYTEVPIKAAGSTAAAEGSGENSPASFEKHPLVLGMF